MILNNIKHVKNWFRSLCYRFVELHRKQWKLGAVCDAIPSKSNAVYVTHAYKVPIVHVQAANISKIEENDYTATYLSTMMLFEAFHIYFL